MKRFKSKYDNIIKRYFSIYNLVIFKKIKNPVKKMAEICFFLKLKMKRLVYFNKIIIKA